MSKTLTITLDERVYDELYSRVGEEGISQFIESVLRPLMVRDSLEEAYIQMAQDEQREAEALEWSEATVGDVRDEAR